MRGLRTPTALVALAMLAVACGNGEDPADTTSPAAEATIDIAGFAFSGPATVEVGTAVTVENQDNLPHTWTSRDDAFNSGSLSQGDTFQHTFDQPGVFEYFCSFHPEMTGVITVEA